MGKVYDALRRAEEERERNRRTGRVTPSAAPREPEESPAAAFTSAAAPEPEPLPESLRKPDPRPARTAVPTSKRSFTPQGVPGDINKRRVALLQPDSFVTEQFRTLRARLASLSAQRPLRTLATASALPGEGKTTAAINLAAVSAMDMERRVLLVDCDLRIPQIHRALGLQPRAGLAEVLTGEATFEEAVVQVEGTNLDVLPVCGQPPNPSELLSSSRMRDLVADASRAYDLVILDTPAVLALPDAKSVTELADGLVLIVRANSTPREEVQAALDILDRRRVLGVVLNDANIDSRSYYGYAS